MPIYFELYHERIEKPFGRISFNGKFVFELYNYVDIAHWNKTGFIPVHESRRVESIDLFRHLNARLPIRLRNGSNDDKLNYIKESGLRVASDGFYLMLLKNPTLFDD